MRQILLAPLLAFAGVACSDAFAATQTTQARYRCDESMPFAKRADGVCFDVGHKGGVLLTDGFPDRPLSRSLFVDEFEDFSGNYSPNSTGDTLVNKDSPWFVKDTSSAGSPTIAIVADADNGQLALAFDSQSEAQVLTLGFNDELNIDSDQEPVIVYRLSVDADFTTSTTTLVWGFADAQNDTEDSTAQNAWFRLDGDLAVDLESDDATTNTDDKSSGVTLTAATLYEFMVCANGGCGGSITDIKFFYRATLGGDWTAMTSGSTTFKMLADTAIQPYLQLRKAANADTDGLKIDYVHVWWNRN